MTDECKMQNAQCRSRLPHAAALCILHFAFCISLLAQTPPSPYTPVAPIPLGDILLSLPTSHIPSVGAWEVRFSHRFNQSIDQGSASDRLHSLFGLDSNADVSIGASWAVRRDLELSLLR